MFPRREPASQIIPVLAMMASISNAILEMCVFKMTMRTILRKTQPKVHRIEKISVGFCARGSVWFGFELIVLRQSAMRTNCLSRRISSLSKIHFLETMEIGHHLDETVIYLANLSPRR